MASDMVCWDTDLIFDGKSGDIIGFEIKKKYGCFSLKDGRSNQGIHTLE